MKNNLIVHTRSHTKERPYLCPRFNCGKLFATKGNMKKHKDYHCDGEIDDEENKEKENVINNVNNEKGSK